MKERDGIFNKRFGKGSEISHPWSYELEYPERPDHEEEDQILWENWICPLTEVRFRDEDESYRLCKSLQGHGIPLFNASGTLDHSNCSTQRAVSTRINLLEYI